VRVGGIFSNRSLRPFIFPVGSVCRKLQRHSSMASSGGGPERLLRSFAYRRFYPHVIGIESFQGRRVLEIGGTDDISMEQLFSRIGARYLNARLEGNPSGNPRVHVGDFMGLEGRFDLVVSLGVFEAGAIDVNFDTLEAGIIRHTPCERAAKLSALLADGGFCVIGTVNAPCFLGQPALSAAGFTTIARETPFYTFMNAGNDGIYAKGDRSELLVISKGGPGKKG
jgi:hypothetical protein